MWNRNMYNETFPEYSVMNAQVNLHYWLSLALKFNIYEDEADHTKPLLESMRKVDKVRDDYTKLPPLQRRLIELELAQLDNIKDPDLPTDELLRNELECIAFRAQHMSDKDPVRYYESAMRLFDRIILDSESATPTEFGNIDNVRQDITALTDQRHEIERAINQEVAVFARYASPKTKQNATFLAIEMKRKWLTILELTGRLLYITLNASKRLRDNLSPKYIFEYMKHDESAGDIFVHTFKVLISHKVTMYFIMEKMLLADGTFPKETSTSQDPELRIALVSQL